MTDATYNGWSNRATWLVQIWYEPRTKSDLEFAKESLEGQEDAIPDGLIKDLLDLSLINWDELALDLEEEDD